MSQTRSAETYAEAHVTNIGGIDEAEVSFSPGVVSLAGRNATNRTSFLRALMAALGSDRASLKGDADEGHVELTLGDDVYTRTLRRENGTVVMGGEPYLDDPEGADLFAFLLENNEARQAVARGDDLREVIMRPVDTDAIQAEITQLEAEKRDIDDRLERLDSLDDRLHDLEGKRARIEDRIEDKRAELEETEAEIDDADDTLDETHEQKAAFDDALDQLKETRSALENVRYRLDTQRESIAALEDERDELDAELDDLPETPAGDIPELDSEISRLRDHKSSLESTITQLQRVLQFNEDLLEGENPELQRALADDSGGDLTDQLVEETTVCWTCGSEVETGAIDDALDDLRDLRQEKSAERSELSRELDELTDRRASLQNERDRRERLDRDRDNVATEIEEREATIEDLEAERDDLETEIEEREAEVEELEAEEQSAVLDLHKQANQLEFEVGRLESDHEDTLAEIESVEDDLAERESLEDRREGVQADLADLRTRIEQLETRAVEEFNEHMETILGVLEYANIDRIWIERTEQRVREGRRTVQRSVFDLHVVRSTDDGTTYEDTVAHLSESEREVTGLVFALAGYLVHEVYETMPFMILDSLEALDAERIAPLVEYFSDYVDYLVVALLEADAAGLEESRQRITDIGGALDD